MKWVTLMSKRRYSPFIFEPVYWTLSSRYEYGMTKWEEGLADTYAVKVEMGKGKNELLKLIELDPFWVEEFLLWALEKHDQSLNAARKIFHENLGRKSNSELAELLDQLFKGQVYGKAVICLEVDTRIQNDLENFLVKKIKNKRELVKVIQTITSPTRMSAEMKKRLEFLGILSNFQEKGITPKLKKEVKELVNKYGWIGTSTGGKPLTTKEVELALKKERKVNAKAELEKIIKRYERLKRERERLSVKYKLAPTLKRCADYLSESAYIRQYRKEMMDMMVGFTRPLYNRISQRLGLTMEELFYLWPVQVRKGLKGKISKEKLRALSAGQRKFSVVAFEKKKFIRLSGSKARKYFAQQETEEKELEKGVLYGRSVYMGRVKGMVKVVVGPADFSKVNKGDILVATQTPPEFIPVISKAGAVVVDEGGVTSHASLLCREFEVPGIIGTKVATKVLKDGDKVEVDAEKGIVKILKKAK